MWCWAASGQMVMDYLGHSPSQCLQANNLFDRKDCPCTQCPPPVKSRSQPVKSNPPPCVQGGWPELERYGFNFKNRCNASLSWDELREQISSERYCKKTPVLFSWRYRGGGGHMMVAIGYKTIDGKNYVEILDPLVPCTGNSTFIPYDVYANGPDRRHRHWHDYYDITYTRE